MSPEDAQDLLNRVAALEGLLAQFTYPDRYEFGRAVRFTGLKIGFFDALPTTQSAAIAQAAGGATVDSQARTAINTLLVYLKLIGFTK